MASVRFSVQCICSEKSGGRTTDFRKELDFLSRMIDVKHLIRQLCPKLYELNGCGLIPQ